jgi:ABC-type methionine transport system ATPase subunit
MQKVKLELTFPGTLKDEAIICDLCKKFNIVVRIMEASFSTSTGWAILALEGQDQEMEKALSFLRNKGVNIADVAS